MRENLSDKEREEQARNAALARWRKPRTQKPSKDIALLPYPKGNPRTPEGQGVLDLQIEKQTEIDGVGANRFIIHSE